LLSLADAIRSLSVLVSYEAAADIVRFEESQRAGQRAHWKPSFFTRHHKLSQPRFLARVLLAGAAAIVVFFGALVPASKAPAGCTAENELFS
jgi:hypothetical protein